MANKASRKKSEKEIANEKSERIMNGIAVWAGFYRANPHRFVVDYLNIKNPKVIDAEGNKWDAIPTDDGFITTR